MRLKGLERVSTKIYWMVGTKTKGKLISTSWGSHSFYIAEAYGGVTAYPLTHSEY